MFHARQNSVLTLYFALGIMGVVGMLGWAMAREKSLDFNEFLSIFRVFSYAITLPMIAFDEIVAFDKI